MNYKVYIADNHEQLANDHLGPSINKVSNVSLNSQSLTSLVFSNIIGNNLGPHFFPLESLAILMWLETMRRKGVTIRLREYLKVGSVVSVIEVTVASLVLWWNLLL